ncbi:MAG: M23 family metallopeptidase [Bacteroidales bacterium]|nr:M23 family metallopeptidase [Bacteroides sp.]MCM1199024.1 M23 family metallopeptidase [Clostridium sp.]MCM1502420.1 M23 family metallopeptidase [Bacteroidales bacterium]
MARQNKDNKVKDYRIDIVDHRSHKTLWTQRFSRTGLITYSVSAIIFIFIGFYCLIAFTPVRKTIPGYPDSHSKKVAIRNAIKVDSLERLISRWELYSENLRRVIDGEAPVKIDSIIQASASTGGKSREELSRKDSLLRQNVINEEQFGLSNRHARNLPIEGMHFFTPLKGVISQGYDVVHPYIDITAPENSVVMAVLDGAVIFAGWNNDTGYTIQIQHENDLISIYKHNRKLLKKTGDKVMSGTPIALVGGTGELSTGEHLHFELWYKGEAIDPTKYINF